MGGTTRHESLHYGREVVGAARAATARRCQRYTRIIARVRSLAGSRTSGECHFDSAGVGLWPRTTPEHIPKMAAVEAAFIDTLKIG